MNSLQADQVAKLRAPGQLSVRTYTEQFLVPSSCPHSFLCLCKGKASPHSLGLQPYLPRCLLPALEALIWPTEHTECTGLGSNAESVIPCLRDTCPLDLVSTPAITTETPVFVSVRCAGCCVLVDLKKFSNSLSLNTHNPLHMPDV